MLLFRLFERLLEPTAPPEDTVPPSGLVAFYWYYARQARWLVGALFVAGFLVAPLSRFRNAVLRPSLDTLATA